MMKQPIDTIELEIRQRVKNSMKNREERSMPFHDEIPSFIHSIDRNGCLLNVTDRWLEKMGYKREEVIGHKSVEFLTEESRRYAESVTLPKFMKTGYAQDIPYEFVTKSGEIIDVLLSAIAEWDEDGNYTRSLVILIDSTEQKMAEAALRESEEKYRNLVEKLKLGIYILQENKFKYASATFEKMLGYKFEEVSSDSFDIMDLVATESKDFLSQRLISREKGEEIDTKYIFKCRTKAGEIKDLEVHSSIIEYNGKPAVHGVINDVTETQEIQRQLKDEHKRLESILYLAVHAIITIDEKGIIKSFNKAAVRIFGYTEDEIIGGNIKILMPDPNKSKHDSYLYNYHRTGEAKIIGKGREAIGKRKNGETFPLKLSISRVDLDNVTIYTGLIEDLTERNQARKEKLELQEKLKQSERMESLGLLAGGVAHDLNNIIAPIMAYPELIRRDLEAGNPIYKDLDSISASVQRAADVIADLLALARRGNYKMETLDLNDLVNEYLDSAEYNAAKKLNPEVSADIQLSKSTLLFKGSNAHLPKVIMNLINNAFESMPEGGVLSIGTSFINVKDGELNDTDFSKGRYNLLTIEDQGEGISEENISKIFDPFFTTKKKTGKMGTGLGLSVVYNVLKDHGAYIDIESKLAIGTKFSIYFPETSEKKEMIQNDTQVQQGSGSILVVDDREEQRDLATRILTALGYDVKSVDSGQESIRYLKNNQTDLIWLDMILEDEMDGLDTYKEIIKMKPNQKTIIVSGYSESDRVKEAKKLGVNGFIQKPYKIDEIGINIHDVLDGAKSS